MFGLTHVPKQTPIDNGHVCELCGRQCRACSHRESCPTILWERGLATDRLALTWEKDAYQASEHEYSNLYQYPLPQYSTSLEPSRETFKHRTILNDAQCQAGKVRPPNLLADIRSESTYDQPLRSWRLSAETLCLPTSPLKP